MKQYYRVFTMPLWLAVFLILLPAANTITYQVTGVLVDADQSPIFGVPVLLLNHQDEQIALDQTDDQGRFTLAHQVTSADPADGADLPAEFKPGASYPNPLTGRIWMDRNQGASRAATSSTDTLAYGDLYQWGRAADGHQKRNSPTTTTLSSTDQPGHGSFITGNSGANWDWRSPRNDNLWQGVNGVNNPCPAGYRLPTEAEWNASELLMRCRKDKDSIRNRDTLIYPGTGNVVTWQI